MLVSEAYLTDYLLSVMRGVLEDLEIEEPRPIGPEIRFADAFDSMAMVEFLGIVADDCGCEMTALEECVGQEFSSIGNLAGSMHAAGLAPTNHVGFTQTNAESAAGLMITPLRKNVSEQLADLESRHATRGPASTVWLAGAAARLPQRIQSAPELDAAIGRPAGWLQRRAGIIERHIWGNEDPIEAAGQCGAEALRKGRVARENLGALLTVSESPPVSVGLAAAVHRQLGLDTNTPCFELNGACTGFLSAMSLAQPLISQWGPILIVSVECHSRWLPLVHGAHGESAALFGDGCAAVLLAGEPGSGPAAKLIELKTYVDGRAADLIEVRPSTGRGFCLEMDGVPLTEFALHALATATRNIAGRHGISMNKLRAIVAHGGNGRMPAMLARLLHVPAAKVWSEVNRTGNLGSASVPVAWASRTTPPDGPLIWTAVGAGLVWGAALWDIQPGP